MDEPNTGLADHFSADTPPADEGAGPGDSDMSHHVWLADCHIRSAEKLADKPRDLEELGKASRALRVIGTPDQVLIEFDAATCMEVLLSLKNTIPKVSDPSRLTRAHTRLYKALSVEVGGSQHLPPELSLEGLSAGPEGSEEAA